MKKGRTRERYYWDQLTRDSHPNVYLLLSAEKCQRTRRRRTKGGSRGQARSTSKEPDVSCCPNSARLASDRLRRQNFCLVCLAHFVQNFQNFCLVYLAHFVRCLKPSSARSVISSIVYQWIIEYVHVSGNTEVEQREGKGDGRGETRAKSKATDASCAPSSSTANHWMPVWRRQRQTSAC